MTTRRIDGIKYNLDKLTDEELKHLLTILSKKLVSLSNDMTEVRLEQRKRKNGNNK